MPPISTQSLPPPPKGQVGVPFSALSQLPPPPSGQKGLSLNQVTQEETTPTFGQSIKNALGGAVYGFSAPGRTIQNVIKSTLGIEKTDQRKGFEQATGVDLNSGAGRTGNVIGETATYLAAPGGLIKVGIKTALPAIPRIGSRIATNMGIATAQTGDIKQGLTTAAISEGITGALKPVATVGKAVYKGLAIPVSAREAKMLQTYKANNPLPQRLVKGNAPVTAVDTAFDKGLFGTEPMIGVQAKREQKKVWNTIVAPALKNNPTKVDLPTFFNDVERQIITSTPEVSRQKALINALNSFRDDYTGKAPVTLEELQNLKSGWAQPVPEKAYKGENIAGAANDVSNSLASQARSLILSNIKDPAVKRGYIDYGNLDDLAKWGQKAMTGSKLKGGSFAGLSAIKDMIVVPIATTGGLVTYKAANGATYFGAPGAKTISDLLNESSREELQQVKELKR